MTLKLTSTAFVHNAPMPPAYTCDGDNVAPPLTWSGVPEGTKSLALIVDDPDAPDPKAPKRTFVHWVVWDIPVTAEGIESDETLPQLARVGFNDKKLREYTGPCPPIGRHRYFFKLYALDTTLGDIAAPTKDALLDAMRGHVLEQTELIGTYERAPGAR